MSKTLNGRATRVEMALTYSAAKTVSAVTKTYPGVATSTAHAMVDGTVGYWTVDAGMVELHEQATRVKNSATNSFDLQSLDATDFGTFTAGTFTPVATWGTIVEATAFGIGGGTATQQDDTRLIDVKSRQVNGMLSAQNVTIDVRSQTVNSAVMAQVESNARRNVAAVFRITLEDGAVRVFYGAPSLPGESVSSGQLGTGQFAVTVPQWVLKGAA